MKVFSILWKVLFYYTIILLTIYFVHTKLLYCDQKVYKRMNCFSRICNFFLKLLTLTTFKIPIKFQRYSLFWTKIVYFCWTFSITLWQTLTFCIKAMIFLFKIDLQKTFCKRIHGCNIQDIHRHKYLNRFPCWIFKFIKKNSCFIYNDICTCKWPLLNNFDSLKITKIEIFDLSK